MSLRSSSSTPQTRRSSGKSRLASAGRFSIKACIAGSKRSRSLSWRARHSASVRANTPVGSRVCMRISTLSTISAPAPSRSAISAIEPAKYPASSRRVDQRRADQPLGRIGEEDRGLALEMVAKRQGFGDVGLEVRRFAGVGADADPRPRVRSQAVGRRGFDRRRGAVRIEGVVDLGAEIGGEAGRVRLQRLSRPVAGLGGRFGSGGGAAVVDGIGACFLALLRPLEQRIARQFVLDELGQLEVRHLQELDRLQQLRRQNHSLTLPHRQFGRERHTLSPALHPHPHQKPRSRPRLASCFSRRCYSTSRNDFDRNRWRRNPLSIVSGPRPAPQQARLCCDINSLT